MTTIRINKGDAFTVTAHYVPSNPSSIRSRSRAAADLAEAVAMARELADHTHCVLVTMHDESGALQGFAHGPACIDLSPEDGGFTLYVPVFKADTLPGIWDRPYRLAMLAKARKQGAETMPGLIDLYAAHDASKAD